jgi:hypothetical protein
MRRPKQSGDREAGLRLPRLKPGQARGRRGLAPWWARMLKRVESSRRLRHQSKRGAGGKARSRNQARRLYGRRSVVKASFRRNRHNRGWTAHARYLAREGAQHEHGRGLGFDAEREDLDTAAIVRDWERSDRLMWSFIISPEDADRIDLRRHVRDLVAGTASVNSVKSWSSANLGRASSASSATRTFSRSAMGRGPGRSRRSRGSSIWRN